MNSQGRLAEDRRSLATLEMLMGLGWPSSCHKGFLHPKICKKGLKKASHKPLFSSKAKGWGGVQFLLLWHKRWEEMASSRARGGSHWGLEKGVSQKSWSGIRIREVVGSPSLQVLKRLLNVALGSRFRGDCGGADGLDDLEAPFQPWWFCACCSWLFWELSHGK